MHLPCNEPAGYSSGVRTELKTLPKEGEEQPGGLALPASKAQVEYSGIPEKGKEQSMASGDLSQVHFCQGLGED